MKRYIAFIISVVLSTSVFAQQEAKTNIRANEIELGDVTDVLTMMGVSMYSFDLSELTRTSHSFYIYIDSHCDSTVKEVYSASVKSSIRYVNDFAENQRAEVRKIYNLSENEQVVSRRDKLGIYMLPENDSTIKVSFNIANYGTMRYVMKLKAVQTSEKPVYFYSDRPFKLEEFKEGEKIPLILYGSGWYDSQNDIVRMCGESQIDPHMSKNEILGSLPQYYVIGIRAKKIDK